MPQDTDDIGHLWGKCLKAHVGGQRTKFYIPYKPVNVPLMGKSSLKEKKETDQVSSWNMCHRLQMSAKIKKQNNLTQKSSHSVGVVFVHLFWKWKHYLVSFGKNNGSKSR